MRQPLRVRRRHSRHLRRNSTWQTTRTSPSSSAACARNRSVRKVAQGAHRHGTRHIASCEIVEIGNLPLYNQDDDANPPAASAAFKQRIERADALLFVTPEYNRSVPGVLKNAIDIASRPYGKSAWNGKPGAVVSLSPGAIGASAPTTHLRQSLVFLNVPVMQQPEAYVGNAGKLFDDQGTLDQRCNA